jgi:hypothetical protein
VLTRILRVLDDSPDLPQAWEPLPEDFFREPLPGGIVSCWAFALRGGGTFTNERHPNSWQRSIRSLGLDGERVSVAKFPLIGHARLLGQAKVHQLGAALGQHDVRGL